MGHDHPAHVAHHFDSAGQQFESGKLGMWLFLATEILLFGGLFCAYAAFTDATLFNRYVMVSPSLWWDDGVCFRYEEAHWRRSHSLPLHLFVTAG